MQLLWGTSDNVVRPSVATIGFFDGVHRGHRFLIEQVRDIATTRNLASSVITFPVHPRKVMHPDFHPELLTTCDEKVALLADVGLDYCIMLDFTPELAHLSAKQFMTILKENYRIEALVIGHDHRFGHNRSEGFEDYVRYGQELGMEVILARAYSNDGIMVSSSVIRRLLSEGNASDAGDCLGYPFFLDGTVVGGYHVGRKISFPTANLRVNDAEKLVPADGVYAVYVFVGGQKYAGMLSIGYRPTLNNGTDRSIEVHIFHFDANIYNQPMRISFVRYTRPELKFNSIEELIEQLHKDAAEVKVILS
ncbi:MAG: bifunctional riboflavin kinase/FAD synthetase [Bacteroides sp.]|nr:bifunctional riboflavin kinase/FAD synthetase [Bacteroides sp.]